MRAKSIRPKHRDAIIQSLRAGVVPRIGQQHIQVGRVEEIRALVGDLERIADGGSAIRFIIGEYGSGKTFFLFLLRSIALEKNLVTVHADLHPLRRLHASGGQARSLYNELMINIATRSKPEGGALASIVEKFIANAASEARSRSDSVEVVIREKLENLSEMVGGFDFADVIASYWRGHDTGDDELKSSALRWLRAEYSTKTEARQHLGVRSIIDDATVYDHLKLMARFVRLAGYTGLMVVLDELVNLYKLSNTQARNANYEQILRILNDCLQGSASGLGFLLAGTPDFLLDTRRGLYSYEALQSRLAENRFATGGLVDYSGPVIRLANLSPEDLYVLLGNIRHVFAAGDESKYLVPDQAIHGFMEHCSSKIGSAYFQTPRNSIRAFVDLLSVLEQNPGVNYQTILGEVQVEVESNPDIEALGQEDSATEPRTGEEEGGAASDDELTSFRL